MRRHTCAQKRFGALHYVALFSAATMTQHRSRHRIKFSEVAIGQRFYDPVSQEYFVKRSATIAAMVTGGADGTEPDEFEPDDIVGIDH